LHILPQSLDYRTRIVGLSDYMLGPYCRSLVSYKLEALFTCIGKPLVIFSLSEHTSYIFETNGFIQIVYVDVQIS